MRTAASETLTGAGSLGIAPVMNVGAVAAMRPVLEEHDRPAESVD